MTTIIKSQNKLVVPSSLQRKAGIKSGDRVVFAVSPRTITITAEPARTYKPTKAELAAIRKGEVAIARGESVSLSEFIDDLDRPSRKTGTKGSHKVSR
jgi:bifunctional DNA-binding transcriptional regulator/antitoxin component of YhaV-PrlF toxin-antitoxin module